MRVTERAAAWTWATKAAVLAVAVVVALLGATRAAHAATGGGPGLQGAYFQGAAFQHKVLVRADRKVDFAWGAKAPTTRLGRDGFSVRWTGAVEAATTGQYTFFLRADDGARLWIDGKRRIDRWKPARGAKEAAAPVQLAAGRHTIRLDYYDARGPAAVRLAWKGPGIAKQVVPAASLVRPGTPLAPQCADHLDNDGDARSDFPNDPDCTSPTDHTETSGPAESWSDPATWGGAVPADGASVTIPAGKVVVLDRSVSLANLTIAGTLQFARQDLTIETDWIMDMGRLEIGTEAQPFQQTATIRLRDRTPGEDVMGMGDKTVGVMSGALELHGQQRLGWTHLAASAPAGATQITLARAPDWRPGDHVAIASTDYGADQAEEKIVTAVSGATVTFDTPLKFLHFGQLQTFDGRSVDERAEVGLLTRNVTVEGDPDSSKNGYGGTVMVMGDGASAHLSGVQLQHVGQAGILRRYPFHVHMLGDGGAGSYVRDSAIHDSNNRCLTIHGTNGTTVSGNVCYGHKGHGIFLEDGAEHGNTIAGNLVFGTQAPAADKRLLPSDAAPASFWVTDTDNTVRGNVAAGSDGHGFWIALAEHPTGLFAKLFPAETAATWLRRMPVTAFADNTGHSNDRDGLHFDDGPNPDGTTDATFYAAKADPAKDDSTTLTTTLPGFVGYKNRGTGAWLRGSAMRLTGAVLADNANGAQFASDETVLADSLVVGETANLGSPAEWERRGGGTGTGGRSLARPWDAGFPVRGFSFYDGRVGVERTTFVNFQPYTAADGTVRQESALGYDVDDVFSIHPRNYVTGARFVNAKPVFLETPEVGQDGDESAVFLDSDGSVTGTAGRSVTTNNPFLFGSGCAFHADWNAEECTGDYASLVVEATDNHAAVHPVTVTRPDGRVQTLTASTGDAADGATTTVLAGSTYRVAFTGGTPGATKFVLQHGEGRSIRIDLPRGPGFKVVKYGCDVGGARTWCAGAAVSAAALDAQAGSGYWYDGAAQVLHLKLAAAPDAGWEQLEVAPA